MAASDSRHSLARVRVSKSRYGSEKCTPPADRGSTPHTLRRQHKDSVYRQPCRWQSELERLHWRHLWKLPSNIWEQCSSKSKHVNIRSPAISRPRTEATTKA